MTDFAEMVPTEEDLRFLSNTLLRLDREGNLGDCGDHKDQDDYCQMCTALQRLNSLVNLMADEDAWIGTK